MSRGWWITTVCWLLILVLPCAGGCTRRFFRKQADAQVYSVLGEKDQDPRWKIEQFHVYPDPRARFADWTNPDRPPMPPDDPLARALSPNPQRPGHAGIAYVEGDGYLKLLEEWDYENRREAAQRKEQRDAQKTAQKKTTGDTQKKMIGAAGPTVPIIDAEARPELQNELADPVSQVGLLPPAPDAERPKQKPYLLTMEQAVELATINSREFQTKRELLYLAALPLTLERYAFAAQFFAIETIVRERAGANTSVGAQNQWAFNTTGGATKLFSTGAQLLMQFANQTVVNLGNFAGTTPIRTVSQSALNLDLLQPLLRGGGRAVTLEPLTQAERNLLYAVRDYARFRQEFFGYISVGQAAFIPGVQAGVAALSAGTVQSPNAFVPFATPVAAPDLAGPVVPGQGGRLGALLPGNANPQGYLNTLLQKVQLINSVKNVNSLEYFFKLLKVYQEGGIVNPVQVGQIEQTLLRGIENMLANWAQYRQALDLFRIQLGLPTILPLELDDGLLRPMYDLIERYEENSTAYALVINETMQFDKYEEADKVRQRLQEVFAKSALVEGLPFQKEGPRRWADWEKLAKPADITGKLKSLRAELNKLLDRKADLELKGQVLSDKELQLIDSLSFDIDLGEFESLLRAYEAQPWKVLPDDKQRRSRQASMFGQLHRAFVPLLSVAVRERLIRIRASWPALPPVFVGEVDLLGAADDTALDTVVRTAFENRLDLMNQRAQLVDSWRKLAVAANSLMGVFNVEYRLDSSTPPGLGQPFVFSANGTRHQLIFNTELPLVRRQERNNYRSALIAYQIQRRAWMNAQDQVAFAVRFQLRNLRITAYNYHKVQKRAMELAYLQVDQSLQAFSQPVAPAGPQGIGGVGPPSGGGSGTGDPAALTQQLLNTQNSLVNAQNDLYSQWLGYIQNRINLYRDMGLMPLDSRGVWLDDVSHYHAASQHPDCPQPEGPVLGNPVEQLPPARLLAPAVGPPN